MKYCSGCAAPIHDNQGSKFCSMCYGDPWHGKDGYYLLEIQEHEKQRPEQETEFEPRESANKATYGTESPLA